jgi:hypothetical protein
MYMNIEHMSEAQLGAVKWVRHSWGASTNKVRHTVPWLRHYVCAVTTAGTENPIYVSPEKELRGLSPNSYILSVSDLLVHMFGCRK